MPAAVIQLKPGEEHNEHQYQRHDLGTKAVTQDGRVYRYGKMGAVVGVAGNLYQGALPVANLTNIACDVVRAVGATQISATDGGTGAGVDDFAEGYVTVNDAAGQGHLYVINRDYRSGDGHAVAASGAVLTVNITHPVKVALTTASEVTFSMNRWKEVLIDPAPGTATIAGVAPHAVTANYFCWLQTGGRACVLTIGSVLIGDVVVSSATTSGGVMPSAAFETDGPQVGICAAVNVTGEYSAIDLLLDN